MTETQEIEELKKLIDTIQSNLTELFEEFRELRLRFDKIVLPEGESSMPSDTIFSSIEKAPPVSLPETNPPPVEESDITPSESDTPPQVDIETTPESESIEDLTEDESYPHITQATVSRHLDPITHEIETGNSPAEVLAEYLQAAKDALITKDNPNPKVARDMDIVLRFLRARGARDIRDEERSNILRRIERWRVHLLST